MPKYTNELIHESSPYLLQHAHNPVNWRAWNTETLLQARKENKPLLLSIGYATCHWCHVMEHESFENEEVAKIMNENFICIKVDREERPDIDQVYMDAVNLLTGRGGWPLHAITLPDGKPFWGGTYYPTENWVNILKQIANMWTTETEKLHEYAENLTNGIQQKDAFPFQADARKVSASYIKEIVQKWNIRFDHTWGGMNKPPKFPLPNNYHFLLRYAMQSNDEKLLNFVFFTLDKISFGGIYDHNRGGFSRYATDIKWHIPHFEKMLYDNAQLVSLYTDAYLISKNPQYMAIVVETLIFIENELTDPETGGFFTALDADSEEGNGKKEEGAYYVWSQTELQKIITTSFDLFTLYYNINPFGHWENGKYVLIKKQSDADFAKENEINIETLQHLKKQWKSALQKHQMGRKRPILDDKILTSWNALTLKAYVDSYRVFGTIKYLESAKKNARFLLTKMLRPDGGLNRNYKNGKSTINAYLEDYATLIDALVSLHEVSLEEKWLLYAKQLTDYTLAHFYDPTSGFFYFTSDEDAALANRKIDLTDDVIPSANSIMGRNLFKLSHFFNQSYYEKVSKQMLNNVYDHIQTYPSSFSNWLFLALDMAENYYEIAISGTQAKEKLKEFHPYYIPNALFTGSEQESTMQLLADRFVRDKTFIYVCVNQSCLLPQEKVSDALHQIDMKLTF